jgi:hypothetical protein
MGSIATAAPAIAVVFRKSLLEVVKLFPLSRSQHRNAPFLSSIYVKAHSDVNSNRAICSAHVRMQSGLYPDEQQFNEMMEMLYSRLHSHGFPKV